MRIAANQPHHLLYRRSGYPDVVLRLTADGGVANPPGHAEAAWLIPAEGEIEFRDSTGAVTAMLRHDGDKRYRGTLLDRCQAELYELPPRPPRRAGPIRYFLYIPHVNRLDLLRKAIASVQGAFAGRLTVVDNSADGELADGRVKGCEIVTPPVPLSFTQTQNWMQRLARRRECDLLFFMHSDGEAAPGAAETLLRRAETIWAENLRLGAIFTQYDVLCAYSMAAVDAIGPWDTVFTQYYADNDYYRRLENAAFELIHMRDIAVSHVGSATLHSDPARQRVNNIFFPVFGHYYHEKCSGRMP